MSTIKSKYVSAPINGSTVEPLVLQTNNLDRVTVDASGNVGISMGAPAARLHVSDGSTGLDNGTIRLGSNPTYYSQIQHIYNNNELRFSVIGGGQFQTFYTNGSERARIDSSGNLLVGTTSLPSSTTRVHSVPVSNAAFAYASTQGGTGVASHSGFYNANGLVGQIYTTGSSTVYVTSSDYRLKENAQPMTGALEKVLALKPCTYTWKVDGSDGQGFIAHELQAVVPECVMGEKDAVNEDGSIKPQGIDTSFLVATLTAAIQELKAELDITKAKVAALEAA